MPLYSLELDQGVLASLEHRRVCWVRDLEKLAKISKSSLKWQTLLSTILLSYWRLTSAPWIRAGAKNKQTLNSILIWCLNDVNLKKQRPDINLPNPLIRLSLSSPSLQNRTQTLQVKLWGTLHSQIIPVGHDRRANACCVWLGAIALLPKQGLCLSQRFSQTRLAI